MSPTHLLDTNILSALMKSPSGPVARRLGAIGSECACTSIVVAAELRYGVAKSGSQRLAERIEGLLQLLPVLPLETPADRTYGALRATLERTGRPIGQNDMIIAAQALCLDLVLVTDNEAEFRRVPDLRIENWLR